MPYNLELPDNFDPSKMYQEPEVFVDLPYRVTYIYDIDFGRYMISTWGRIYDKLLDSYRPQLLIRPDNKYIRFELKNSRNEIVLVTAHRIVAATFLGVILFYKEEPIINHKDGVKWHNEPSNLEWCDIQYNTIHAYKTGLNKFVAGEHGNARLTDEQYRQICELTAQGYRAKDIDKIMNLDFSVAKIANNIRTGQSEKYIASEYDFSNIPRNDYHRLSENEVKLICEQFQSGNFDYCNILKSALGVNINDMDDYHKRLIIQKLENIKSRASFTGISNKYDF